MKKVLYYFIFVPLLSCHGGREVEHKDVNIKSQTKQLNIKGSDTELPLSEKEIESYMQIHPDASISLTGGGSTVGITALIEGNTDIAMASREPNAQENINLQAAGQNIRVVTIAYDALAVIVNPQNKIDKITREALDSIYTGIKTAWNSVSNKTDRISALGRENSSGSCLFFKEHVLKGKNYSSGVLQLSSNGRILETISHDPAAIGYVGLDYVNDKVKILAISYDGGKTYVAASAENVKNKKYPVSRSLYYIYPVPLEDKVKPFIDFVLSDEGQKNVEKAGFVRINK